MKYKAFCTDIDGTFLDANRQLSKRTIAAVKQLDQDIPVILASSRMPSAMRHLQQELEILHHPLICYNGGYVLYYNLGAATPEVIDSVQIPVEICQYIRQQVKETDIHVSLYQNDDWFAPRHDEWTQREIRNTKVTPSIAAPADTLARWEAAGTGAHKVMCMGPEKEIQVLEEALNASFADQIYVYKSKSTYLELASRQISKATALELLLQKKFDFGMSEVVAFGDNYNDIDMLKAVGMGVAVGSARPEVKEAAKETTAASVDDGVAMAIEKYFL